jgi:hypothetical protein
VKRKQCAISFEECVYDLHVPQVRLIISVSSYELEAYNHRFLQV